MSWQHRSVLASQFSSEGPDKGLIAFSEDLILFSRQQPVLCYLG